MSARTRAPTHMGVLDALIALDIESGKPDRALAMLNRAILSQPDSAPLFLRRAKLQADLGRSFAAIADASRAYKLQPHVRDNLRLLSWLVATQGDLRGTIASLENRDAGGHPLSPNQRVLLARLYLLSGEDDEARAAYDKALADGSTVTEAKADLAFLLAKQTDVDDETIGRALTLAREAVAAMPDDAQSLDILGLVYLRQGDAATALGQFRQALEQPGAARPDIHYHAGMALRALDRNREAVQAFERALEIDSNFHQAADARRQLEIARKAAGVQTESG